jgi:hypothetical protein
MKNVPAGVRAKKSAPERARGRMLEAKLKS